MQFKSIGTAGRVFVEAGVWKTVLWSDGFMYDLTFPNGNTVPF